MGLMRELASELPVSERTLRRTVASGLIRAERTGARKLRLTARERRYLYDHWGMLSSLLGALRTERNARMAVLFGSTATGDDDAGSDVDLLVSLRDDHVFRVADLEARLSGALGREVEIARLSSARGNPILLAEALRHGRVLVDRDTEWRKLRERQDAIAAAAERARREKRRRAAAAIAALTGES